MERPVTTTMANSEFEQAVLNNDEELVKTLLKENVFADNNELLKLTRKQCTNRTNKTIVSTLR